MKLQELKQLIREETRKVLKEGNTKNILGIQFNIVPFGTGIKFQFKNSKAFRTSGISVNELVSEITKMLDAKFGKGTFIFMPAGRPQDDPSVNGLEFKMNANNFFKDL